MKKAAAVLIAFLLAVPAFADAVNFASRAMTAGKSSLTKNSYIVSRMLDTANLSPELRLPIQLIYDSSSDKSGIFGFGWRSPQLESTAYYDKDGVLWITPWGEKIKFFPKKEKTPKDAIKIELYEQAKKGRGFFAPYSEWEASSSKRDFVHSTDWIFHGRKDKQGWTFVYRDGKLRSVTAPSGRKAEFQYTGSKLVAIVQQGTEFVELAYSGNVVTSVKINGTAHELKYRPVTLRILPKTVKGNLITASRPCLASIMRGELSPVMFTYDDYGFLNGIRQGDYADELVIQHQTLAEKRTELQSKDNRKIKYNGPINGRIVSDNQFRYSYASLEPGAVTLTNRSNQRASYLYDAKTGIFRITEFSGKRYTIYYFMRYDVAYLGKVRKIVDGRDRDVVNYRYDKLSGNVIRIRNMIGNDINFEYGENGKVSRITRRSSEQDSPEPIRSFKYDEHVDLIEVATLDAAGQAVSSIKIRYTQFRQPADVTDGRTGSSFRYNAFGYPVAVTDVFGRTVTRELDKYNRLISSTDFYGVRTVYTYTPAGLISKIERRDGETLLSSLAIIYDGNGRPASYTDQSGKTKKFERDAFGRVVKEQFPDDTEVSYTYNALGQLHTVLDQNRHTIRFDWSRFGLDARTTPAGQLTDYVHDKYGLLQNVISKGDRRVDKRISYQYDQYDRPIKVDYGNGQTVEYTYDAWGRIASVRRGEETEVREYDYWGRLISKRNGDRRTSYVYNHYGQRIAMNVQNGAFVKMETRSYDNFGRLTSIKSGKDVAVFYYNARNQLECQMVNGTPIRFFYDKYGRLLKKEMSPMSQSESDSSKGGKK